MVYWPKALQQELLLYVFMFFRICSGIPAVLSILAKSSQSSTIENRSFPNRSTQSNYWGSSCVINLWCLTCGCVDLLVLGSISLPTGDSKPFQPKGRFPLSKGIMVALYLNTSHQSCNPSQSFGVSFCFLKNSLLHDERVYWCRKPMLMHLISKNESHSYTG